MSAEVVELEFPEAPDDGALLTLLGERLRVGAGRPRTADRVLLDTFDGRLRAAGLRAEWSARRGPTRQLTLHEPGVAARHAEVGDARAVPATALPPGPLRDRLAGVLEERALLPLARLRSRALPVAVLNGDEKTVVRLTLERPTVVDGRRSVALAPRLVAEPVRGYERDFERTLRRLRDLPGLSRADAPIFDAAVAAAGRPPEGVSAKVRLDLERGTRSDVAAGLVLARLADVAETNLPGTLDDLDTEFLHDLRVSIRRARSVLRELKDVHAPEEREQLREELRWAQQVTGPVRDLDVQLLEWDELTGPLAEARAADLEPLRQLLEQRRAKELRAMQRALRSPRFAAALESWRELAAGPPAPDDAGDRPRAAVPIEAVSADRIRSVYRRMVRDGSAIDDESPDEALHDLRKRGKELRYLLELFGSLHPGSVVKPMVASLKDLQDVLGRFQDRSVQTEMLRERAEELAGRPGGPGALLAAGLVISALEADQHRARDEFASRFAAFASKDRRATMKKTFRKARVS